jgi:hypothetical protein
MTEEEWLNPNAYFEPMLESLYGIATFRKLRLLAVACGMTHVDRIADERSRTVLEVLERFADSLASREEMAAAAQGALDATRRWEVMPFNWGFLHAIEAGNSKQWLREGELHEGIARLGQTGVDDAVIEHVVDCLSSALHYLWSAQSSALFREIFGNPFRPVAFESRWQISTVDFARAIYHEKSFERMPILAETLMAAGCDNGEILAHCRSEGPHVRGCWVVDLILRKK